eukprot:9896212-Alexandrium_andersonii.AAC.1
MAQGSGSEATVASHQTDDAADRGGPLRLGSSPRGRSKGGLPGNDAGPGQRGRPPCDVTP